ncbi:ABC transporter permease subunit [Halovenus marina]|uniref:ABC transporter permease subunit n=1 Tax=Halovenus marina TaxID=3396621 RepID=UPI003F57718F
MNPSTDPEMVDRTRALLTVAQFEGEQRIRITGILAVVFSLFAALFLWVAPDIVAAGVYEDLFDSMPPALTALFGFESLGSLEGFVAGEYYTLVVVVGLGGYLAYSAAGSVAGDLESERMDTVLAAPVSRTSVLLGTYLSLLVPILVLNAVVPLVLYVGSVLVDDPISLADLAALHVLAIPYLLCWGAVGLFVGVVVRGGRLAGRVVIAVVLGTWLIESVVVETDYEWLGGLAPMRYFEPSAVLVDGSYDVAGAALLLAVAAVLVGASLLAFQRRDL